MGKYLVNLIEEQEKASRALQDQLPMEKQGYLFTYLPTSPFLGATRKKIKTLNKIKTGIEYLRANSLSENRKRLLAKASGINEHELKKPFILKFLEVVRFGEGGPKNIPQSVINEFFPVEYKLCPKASPIILNQHTLFKWAKEIVDTFQIKSEDGKPYNLHPYKFRHNGITDRKEDGFTSLQIRSLTGHAGTEMIDCNYDHSSEARFRKTAAAVRKTLGVPLYFQGRILNMDEKTEAILLRNIQAQRIGKIGICRDISKCQSGLFQCLGCEHLIPDANEEEYYRHQLEEFEKKEKMALERGHKALAENARKNVALHAAILARIKSIIG